MRSGQIHFVCRRCEDLNWPDTQEIATGNITDPSLQESIDVFMDSDIREADGPLDDVREADVPLDASFDLQHRQNDGVVDTLETSNVAESDLPGVVDPDEPTTYKILEKGSKRCARLLCESNGFTYGIKRVNAASTLWRCSVRSSKVKCQATVSQQGDTFLRGKHQHVHPADRKIPMKAALSELVKDKAMGDVFIPAMRIVEDVVLETVPDEEHFLIPKTQLLKRAANRFRSKTRPSEPSDLEFMLNTDHLQYMDFLVDDIRVDASRHLVFASPFQLNQLSQTKRWFMDGTFKVVGKPFENNGQLFSVHSFIKQDGKVKQFPLAFALMSRRRKEDYVQVLRSLKSKLVTSAVETVVLDFEKPAWQAVAEVFPGVNLKGCAFHWNQAVWRHVQGFGLVTSYRRRESVFNYIRQLMALPFRPACHIKDAFTSLANRANTDQLKDLVGYTNRQWICNNAFPIASWSVFRQTVRTNNDVEGWHHRLNSRPGAVSFKFMGSSY